MTEAKKKRKLDGPIHSIGVVLREESPEILEIINRLADWLERRSISIVLEEQKEEGQASLDLNAYPVDLVIALGGDGTLLRAARTVVGTEIPVLGVNLGRLGFLTAFPDAELETGLMQVLDGNARLDHRFTLRAHIETEQDRTRAH